MSPRVNVIGVGREAGKVAVADSAIGKTEEDDAVTGVYTGRESGAPNGTAEMGV